MTKIEELEATKTILENYEERRGIFFFPCNPGTSCHVCYVKGNFNLTCVSSKAFPKAIPLTYFLRMINSKIFIFNWETGIDIYTLLCIK